MRRRALIFTAVALVGAFALVTTLNALDASKPIAQVAAILFCGVTGGIGAALLTPRRHVE